MDVPFVFCFFPLNSAPLTCSIWRGRENISQHRIYHWKFFIGKPVIEGETYCLLGVYNVQGYCRNLLCGSAMAACRYETLALTLE